jgi:hypothetical protein
MNTNTDTPTQTKTKTMAAGENACRNDEYSNALMDHAVKNAAYSIPLRARAVWKTIDHDPRLKVDVVIEVLRNWIGISNAEWIRSHADGHLTR